MHAPWEFQTLLFYEATVLATLPNCPECKGIWLEDTACFLMCQFLRKRDKSGIFDHVPVNIKFTEHRLMQNRMMHDCTWQMNSCGQPNLLESLKIEFSKSHLRVSVFFKALSMLPMAAGWYRSGDWAERTPWVWLLLRDFWGLRLCICWVEFHIYVNVH